MTPREHLAGIGELTVERRLAEVASNYLTCAYLSTVARTKRSASEYRYESRGLLRALETLLGGLGPACDLIAEQHPIHHGARGVSLDKLLYAFWGLDHQRP